MGDLVDGIKLAAAVIVPRREQFETGNFYAWRSGVAAATFLTGCVVSLHIALACGYITLFGFTGFAQAADLAGLKMQQQQLANTVQRSSAEIMEVVIGEQVFDLNYKRCTAIKSKNDSAILAYSQELQGKLEYYQRITGRSYNLQPCP